MKRTSLKPGDVVLRREKGLPKGKVVGTVVVLRLKVKTLHPTKTKEFQKVKFVFLGENPKIKKNHKVGDLYFKDFKGVSKDKDVKEYVKRHALQDAEKYIEFKKLAGNIPVNVYERIVSGGFGCYTEKVKALFQEVYTK